jgi:hypothetical protein
LKCSILSLFDTISDIILQNNCFFVCIIHHMPKWRAGVSIFSECSYTLKENDNSHQDICYWPFLMSEIAVLQLLSMRKSQGLSDNFHHI